MSLNTDAIGQEWAQQCGPCDLGLPMPCKCPQGDPRVVVSQLLQEVKLLRPVVQAAQAWRHAEEAMFTARDDDMEAVVSVATAARDQVIFAVDAYEAAGGAQ